MDITTYNPTTTAIHLTPSPPALQATEIARTVDGVTTLHSTSLAINKGEVIGIAGGSGAGKTTLLEILAGTQRPSAGSVLRSESTVAFVPQDDIIHPELPLRRTLEHAAALRMTSGDHPARQRAVDRVLDVLDLAHRASVPVAALSGGQRKRASLAVEMLADPELFFLDEPTSGLDPAIADELMNSLRQLAASGSTVVFTTHSPTDLLRCDQVIFMAPGGRVAFVGTVAEAKAHFGVDELGEIYPHLRAAMLPDPLPVLDVPDPVASGMSQEPPTVKMGPGGFRQWWALTRRNVDLIKSNRLTLAILAASPIFIIAMMTMLFPSGAFDTDAPSAAMAVQTLFWMAFNSFFFGLTYGLLQIVGEFEIVNRERKVGLRPGAYIASKLTVLVPLLGVVNAVQLGAMETTNRLPALSFDDRIAMFVTLQLLSIAAVAIGLHASSVVQNSSQATLALPMLCFPQVLFTGAVVPVSEMGWFTEAMSLPLASRWGFEPLGRILDLGPAVAAEPGTSGFAEAFTGSATTGWAVLILLAAMGVVGSIRAVAGRTSVGAS